MDDEKIKAVLAAELPEFGRGSESEKNAKAPARVFTDTYAIDVAEQICKLLKADNCGVYRDGEIVFTIEREKEKTRTPLITGENFSIMLEYQKICIFVKGNEEKMKPSRIKADMARAVMSTPIFRAAVPEIQSIEGVRLPVIKNTKGKITFEPMLAGCDKERKIYSFDEVPIMWSAPYSLENSILILKEVFKEFPFDGGGDVMLSRSFGGVIMALLGQFLRHNFELFPIIQINGNQSGLGKSFLVEAINAPFRHVSAQIFPDDAKEIQKKIFTAALEKEAVVFIDEAESAASKALLSCTASCYVKDRLLGSNKNVEVKHKMQFFINGQGIKSVKDFERRTINIDLFCEEDARKRIFTRAADFIYQKDTRGRVLASLWGLCKAWEKAGAPLLSDVGIYAAYKKYIQITNSILVHAGFTSPLEARVVKMDSGDVAGEALQEVLTNLADKIQPSDDSRPHAGLRAEYIVREIVEAAEMLDLLEVIVGGSRTPSVTVGTKLRRLKGRVFVDSYGRKYRIGEKTRGVSTRYPFEILTEPRA